MGAYKHRKKYIFIYVQNKKQYSQLKSIFIQVLFFKCNLSCFLFYTWKIIFNPTIYFLLKHRFWVILSYFSQLLYVKCLKS